MDDSLLFFQASMIQEALALFERCTGQLLSSSKCSILFSEACQSQTQIGIKEILRVEASTFESKYLGLLTPQGRMEDENFNR